jgi:MinD-like ATPase involved in chromosome partitioning or flagellar assembly
MTMHSTDDTKSKDTPPTPSRGESATRHLWKRAKEEGREADAKLIATVANLLKPDIKLADGLPVKKPEKVDSAEVNGQPVDLSEMADSDAEAYRQYAAEMDGSAARERHVARMEEEDAEMTAIFGRRDGS